MKKKAERRVRQLLSEDGFAQPDEVRYGQTSVTLIWHSVNKSIEVDVTERGEVGECRAGPPPRGSNDRLRVRVSKAAHPIRAATLQQKRQAERDARAMLENGGLAQPDEVEYGHACIRLLWHEEKVALVVDITEPPSSENTLQAVPEDEHRDPPEP